VEEAVSGGCRVSDGGMSVEEAVSGGCRAGDGGASVEEAERVEEPVEPGPRRGGAPLVNEERQGPHARSTTHGNIRDKEAPPYILK
jgi:hypothetical protein